MDIGQIILSEVLPIATAIVSAIVSIGVCIGRVRALVGSSSRENAQLKKALTAAEAKLAQLETEQSAYLSKMSELVIAKEQEVESLVKENAALRSIGDEVSKLKDLETTLKQQLAVLIENKEE